MAFLLARDRSLHSVKAEHDQSLRRVMAEHEQSHKSLQKSSHEAPPSGQRSFAHAYWNVARVFSPPATEALHTVLRYGLWLKWACKLLDIKYLQQYWGNLGVYVGELSKRVAEFKDAPKRSKKGIKASP